MVVALHGCRVPGWQAQILILGSVHNEPAAQWTQTASLRSGVFLMKAVIMAGGEGTRLRPLTSHRPKPLTPALNMPIMEHIVLLLKQHGIMDIVVTLHYLADEIE